MIDSNLLTTLKQLQITEITEKLTYIRISKYLKDDANRAVLLKIADEEEKHYNIWKKYTGIDMPASKLRVFFYSFMAKIFGFTFAIKLMEKTLNSKNLNDSKIQQLLLEQIPETLSVINDELEHEKELINMLDEERLQYVGSMVLGLNDALVEFTGSLAGYSFAMQSNKLISLAGLITGISATLSMAASEFLSSRSEGDKSSFKAATYTGIAYFITVVLLILPYILLPEKAYGLALGIMMIMVIGIIGVFNYYISVAKDLSFKRQFVEMASISLSVAAISFIIGLLVKKFLGIDI
jgi:VIT1/CCC1 family predicted Fe2+/Mn2+ transporter